MIQPRAARRYVAATALVVTLVGSALVALGDSATPPSPVEWVPVADSSGRSAGFIDAAKFQAQGIPREMLTDPEHYTDPTDVRSLPVWNEARTEVVGYFPGEFVPIDRIDDYRLTPPTTVVQPWRK